MIILPKDKKMKKDVTIALIKGERVTFTENNKTYTISKKIFK